VSSIGESVNGALHRAVLLVKDQHFGSHEAEIIFDGIIIIKEELKKDEVVAVVAHQRCDNTISIKFKRGNRLLVSPPKQAVIWNTLNEVFKMFEIPEHIGAVG
jgi:hypothetical protein